MRLSPFDTLREIFEFYSLRMLLEANTYMIFMGCYRVGVACDFQLVHPVFHVTMLRKCISDSSLVFSFERVGYLGFSCLMKRYRLIY